jgi:uncharacterized membrane protein YhaH (DUF805 family)
MHNLSPIGWAIRPLKRYAEFSVLYMVVWFAFFGAMISSVAAARQGNPSAGVVGAMGVGGLLIGLFWLALIVPTIAVQVRRLHDTNRSGWWLGAFYLLYAVYFVLIFGMLGAMMTAAASGGGTPPTPPNSGIFMGTMILGFVMFVYMIALLVFYCLPGTRGPNRFGNDPYGANVEEVFA